MLINTVPGATDPAVSVSVTSAAPVWASETDTILPTTNGPLDIGRNGEQLNGYW